MDRREIGALIAERLEAEAEALAAAFRTPGRIESAYVDDLLPADFVRDLYARFPATDRLTLKRSIKENKLVSAQMDQFDALLEEVVYAFQQPRVVSLIADITGLEALEADSELYAGGISVMTKGGYLRPHLDNSHDSPRERYRALNLLFYVTPDWREDYGGSLQLWDDGPLTTPRTFASRFNRLVLMATNRASWHSVNAITHDGRRCCVSNYYFSRKSPAGLDYFHATSFRGEHGGLRDMAMQADNALRTAVLKTLPDAYKNPHVYVREPAAVAR
jgi:Rps23 Pro-64 3,4-dihydroxylase Tpa1-like proline 4-hydroxylase